MSDRVFTQECKCTQHVTVTSDIVSYSVFTQVDSACFDSASAVEKQIFVMVARPVTAPNAILHD